MPPFPRAKEENQVKRAGNVVLQISDDYQLSIEMNNNSFILDIWDHAIYLKHDFTTVLRYARDDKEIITAPVSKYIKGYNKLLAELILFCYSIFAIILYFCKKMSLK